MPHRVTRGEINSSESLRKVSLEADLLFRALIVAVDDFGRMDGRLEMVKSACFPMRPEIDLEKLEKLLLELESADGESGPILRYEVNGRPYLALCSWELYRGKTKRAAQSRHPAPPGIKGVETDVSREIERSLAVVRERKAKARGGR